MLSITFESPPTAAFLCVCWGCSDAIRNRVQKFGQLTGEDSSRKDVDTVTRQDLHTPAGHTSLITLPTQVCVLAFSISSRLTSFMLWQVCLRKKNWI